MLALTTDHADECDCDRCIAQFMAENPEDSFNDCRECGEIGLVIGTECPRCGEIVP